MTTNWLELSKENELLKIRLQILKQDIIRNKLEITERIKSKVVHGEPYIYTYEIGSYIMANDELNTRIGESVDLMIHVQEELDKICYENRRLERSEEYKTYDEKVYSDDIANEANRETSMPDDLKRRMGGEYAIILNDYGRDRKDKNAQRKRAHYVGNKCQQFPQYRWQIKGLCSEMEVEHWLTKESKEERSTTVLNDVTTQKSESNAEQDGEKIAEIKNQ